MNYWRLDNPRHFGNQVERFNPQTTSLGNAKRTGERFSWFCGGDLRAKIEPPSCRQYKPGDILAVRPLNCDEIIDEDEDGDNWADPGAPCGGRIRPNNGNDNDDSEGEEDMQGGENGNGRGKGTNVWKGKGKRTETWEEMGKRNGKGKAIVKQTPAGDDISRAGAVQKEMYEGDSDMEG